MFMRLDGYAGATAWHDVQYLFHLQMLDAVVSSYTNLYCAKEPKRKDFCGVLFPELANSNESVSGWVQTQS